MHPTPPTPKCPARTWADMYPWLPPWRPLYLGRLRCLVLLGTIATFIASTVYYRKALPAVSDPFMRRLLISTTIIQSVVPVVISAPVVIDSIFDTFIQRSVVRAVYCASAVIACLGTIVITFLAENYIYETRYARDSRLKRAHDLSLVAMMATMVHTFLTFSVIIYVSTNGTLRTDQTRKPGVPGDVDLQPLHGPSESQDGQGWTSGTVNGDNQEGQSQETPLAQLQESRRQRRERQQRAIDRIASGTQDPGSQDPGRPKTATVSTPKPATSAPAVPEGAGSNAKPVQRSGDKSQERGQEPARTSDTQPARTKRHKSSDPAAATGRQQPSDTERMGGQKPKLANNCLPLENSSDDENTSCESGSGYSKRSSSDLYAVQESQKRQPSRAKRRPNGKDLFESTLKINRPQL